MYNMFQHEVESSPQAPVLKTYSFYRIHCKDTDVNDSYIGKTTHFEARISQHKMLSNDSDLKLYRCIAQNGGFNNWICQLVHTESCTEIASTFIEFALFKLFEPTLNTRIPRVALNVFQSKKMDYNRLACQTNYAIKCKCHCGWGGSRMSYSHHVKKSKQHLAYLDAEALHNEVFANIIDLNELPCAGGCIDYNNL
jgi:hypothetical protein